MLKVGFCNGILYEKEVFHIKTLIELFDECQLENIVAGLRFLPEKIIFVGFKKVMTRKKIEDLERFLKEKNIKVSLEYEVVGRYDFDAICKKLNAILDANEDCCFDLTGGKELVLVAMGAISAERNVPMIQINVKTGELVRVKNCENITDEEKPYISIKESVILNGGSVIYEDLPWYLTEDFKSDIEKIWEICKDNCGLFNRQITVFGNFERFGEISHGLRVTADLEYMKECHQDTLMSLMIINALIEAGLIYDYEGKNMKVSFRYKNEQVHRCLTKAGNILELYAYCTATEINRNEHGYYDDVDTGIFIDWDGVIHDGTTLERDTRNEIDVMMTKNMIPIFISCKNGEVHKEDLYELSTVAQRFGGKHAKKILLTTYISSDEDGKKYIIQRAKDMKIEVIDGVQNMTKEEFYAVLKQKAK